MGWRYTRAGRATRRNGFISFISAASTLGIALGVWALIVVLSVMNGFQKEVRDRMLSVVSHIEIYEVFGEALPDPAAVMAQARQNPQGRQKPEPCFVRNTDDVRGSAACCLKRRYICWIAKRYGLSAVCCFGTTYVAFLLKYHSCFTLNY